MTPLFISKYGFRDAGPAGYNCPIELALEESEELWPDETVGLVASVGSGLSGLSPPQPMREWVVTDQFAEPYAEAIISKMSRSRSPSDPIRQCAMDVVKHFVTLAVDTEISNTEATVKLSPKSAYPLFHPISRLMFCLQWNVSTFEPIPWDI
jgi:hypothetical protein